MSRIGKKPIKIPSGVKISVQADKVIVEGKGGKLERTIHPFFEVALNDDMVVVGVKKKTKHSSALWGLTRSLIANMVEGVTKGFEKQLEIEGIGYRAYLEGNALVLNVGFSHPVKVQPPVGIKFKVESNTITVSGIDKELVGRVAADIRKIRPPEPYKGKGIRYREEVIRRKAGKKAVAGG